MELMVERAVVNCDHQTGLIPQKASQRFVRIDGSPVLVKPDPLGRSIGGCPNVAVTNKPCLKTVTVKAGYSSWIRIGSHPVCLDTVTGLTDGTPPGTVTYNVRDCGQHFVTDKTG